MLTDSIRQQLIKSLRRGKEDRKAFLTETIRVGIAFQIRANREARNWSQGELGERAAKPQATISRLEDPNKEGMTLNTLIDLASAFDCGLIVRFVPFSEIVGYEARIPDSSSVVPSFGDDKGLEQRPLHIEENVASFDDWHVADLRTLLSKEAFTTNLDFLLESALLEGGPREESSYASIWDLSTALSGSPSEVLTITTATGLETTK
jgi:Predicted transcriptional regulator